MQASARSLEAAQTVTGVVTIEPSLPRANEAKPECLGGGVGGGGEVGCMAAVSATGRGWLSLGRAPRHQ